ncbi:MAG: hypothetical protein Q4C86_10750 [bacterium]|nr:hypothetical protein [bacterium]
MKKNTKLLCFLFLFLSTNVISLLFSIPALAFQQAINPIDGFRGIKWGATVKQYKNELIKNENPFNDPDIEYLFMGYERPFETPTMGGVKTGKFTYCFDEQGFYRAFIILYYFPNLKTKNIGFPSSYADINNRFIKIYNACEKHWGQSHKEVTLDSVDNR